MVESVEWAEAVARSPPTPLPDRAATATTAADQLASMLLALEQGASPTTATAIEQFLQLMVEQYGDAILVDLIGEERQRNMVALLLISMADPSVPAQLAAVRPRRRVLSLPVSHRFPCALPLRCQLRSGMTLGLAAEGLGLSCWCHHARFDVLFLCL